MGSKVLKGACVFVAEASNDQKGKYRWIASLYIPKLPIQVELMRRPNLAGLPIVIASESDFGGGGHVAYTCQEGEAAGLRGGMPLREVFALCRHAVVLPPDFDAYEKAYDLILNALEKAAPAVEAASLGRAFIDITGMERLYPRMQTLLEALLAAVSRASSGLVGRVGAAPNKFVSDVAAQTAADGACVIVPARRAADFLAPLSWEYLPISEEMKQRLYLLGLKTMGEIGTISPIALEAQFGSEGRRAWKLARGLDHEPVVARKPFRPIAESLSFPSPINDWAAFWAGVRELLTRLWRRKERREATVRQLQLVARMEEQMWERTLTLHEPVGDRERLEDILSRRLQGTVLPGAVSSLTVKLTLLGGAYVGQESLFVSSAQRWKRIKEAVASIKARSGSTGLYRIAEVEPWSRIPERRYALISFDP